MFRSLVLVLALLAASASAQDVRATRPIPTTGERVVLIAGALAGGALTAYAGPFLLVGAGAGTYVASRSLGLSPTVGGVLLDTAVGVGVAYVVGGATILALHASGAPSEFGTDIAGIMVGLVAGSAATGLAHGVRLSLLRRGDVSAQPVALASPIGGAAPGLSLQIRL